MIFTSIEMDTFSIYFLQATIGIVLFYFLYLLFLKKDTFYHTNRYFLLADLILATLLPLFPVSYASSVTLMNNADFFSLTEIAAASDVVQGPDTQIRAGSGMDYWDWLLGLYLAGMAFFFMRLAWQTMRISWKIRHSEYQYINGIKIINQHATAPFSFFNVVFIDIQEYSERELSNIIAHEKVHIRERHWIDLLIIELLAVLFWINPVVWLYERSIKQNHEYLADQGVLLAGYSPGQYQALLINQLMGVKVLGFAHNLNFSLNKKRMEMMKKEKSPWASKMKLLLALPIIALLVFAFAKKEYVMVDAENTSIDVQTEIDEGIITNDLITVKGKVTDSEGMPLTGANVILKGTNHGTVVDRQGAFVLEVPKSDKPFDRGDVTIDNAQAIVISFVGYGNHEYVFNTHSEPESKEVKIKLHKASYNVTLPEIGDDEKLIKGTILEFPTPQIGDANHQIDGEIIEVPAPPKKENKEEEIFTIVEDMPYYAEGGMYQLARDIKEQTNSIMGKTQDRGEVVVGFTVSSDGNIIAAHVVTTSDSKMLDASAVKIIQSLNYWRPGVQRGKKVPVDLTVPVNFS
jgi:TonB family protein